MAKETTHKFLTDFVQLIPMGDEIGQSEIKGNATYSVFFVARKKDKDKYENHIQNQWGIIMTDSQGNIVRNYNLAKRDAWSASDFKLGNRHHIFKACWKDIYFAEETLMRLNADSRWKRICQHADEQHEEFVRFKSHWLIRLASSFIKK